MQGMKNPWSIPKLISVKVVCHCMPCFCSSHVTVQYKECKTTLLWYLEVMNYVGSVCSCSPRVRRAVWFLRDCSFVHVIHRLSFNSVCGRLPVLRLQDISSTVLKSSWNYIILERTPGITWSKWAECIPFNYHLSICGPSFSFSSDNCS